MSEILKIFNSVNSWYLILDCGHWYHWTGKVKPTSKEIDCPSCIKIEVVNTIK